MYGCIYVKTGLPAASCGAKLSVVTHLDLWITIENVPLHTIYDYLRHEVPFLQQHNISRHYNTF